MTAPCPYPAWTCRTDGILTGDMVWTGRDTRRVRSAYPRPSDRHTYTVYFVGGTRRYANRFHQWRVLN